MIDFKRMKEDLGVTIEELLRHRIFLLEYQVTTRLTAAACGGVWRRVAACGGVWRRRRPRLLVAFDLRDNGDTSCFHRGGGRRSRRSGRDNGYTS